MKKLLAIAPYPYLPVYSGGQKYIAGFYEHLSRHCELTVVSTPSNDTSLAKGYQLQPLLKNSFARYYDSTLKSRLTDLVRKGKYDAVIWEHPYYAWLARSVKKKTGIRTILHTHNIEHQRFRSLGKWWWPLLRRYERGFFRDADLLLFITKEDLQFATGEWKINPQKCVEIPFGIEPASFPADRAACSERVRARHGIETGTSILLFNGLLQYKPNLEALENIIEHINPFLLKAPGFEYRIIVCGKGLPPEWKELEPYRKRQIIYAGFVEDISEYFKATDVFLNPVVSGGGVKTKIVEAIAYGATVVSTRTGAKGMDPALCGDKLHVVPDQDWKLFADTVIGVSGKEAITPAAYYDHYSWESNIRRLMSAI